jgi:hypothetical protein
LIDSLNEDVVDSLNEDALNEPALAIESGGFTDLVAFSRNCDESGAD